MKYIRTVVPAAFLTFFLLITTALAAPAPLEGVYWFNPATGGMESISAVQVRLTLDGLPLTSDVPALLYQERTMVPVRCIAEALGASVDWNQSTRQVTLTTSDKVILLTIGSSTALVNGQETPLPDGISAQLFEYQGGNSTMVPLRFVSEQLGCTVDWDSATYTAIITRPQTIPPIVEEPEENIPAPPTDSPLTDGNDDTNAGNSVDGNGDSSSSAAYTIVSIETDDNAQTVFLSIQGEDVEDVEYVVQSFEGRAVIDVLDARLQSGIPATVLTGNEIFSAVRYSDHSDLYDVPSVRVVLDLRDGYTCKENVEVTNDEDGILIRSYIEEDNSDTFVPTVPIDPNKSTIVLDAGHGGTDVGANYGGVYEKDINLAVTLKVAEILKGYGYNVITTRSTDTTVNLYDRAPIANAVDADIFVSIHSNANPNTEVYGLSTYCFPNSRRGSLLAQYIQDAAAAATGAKNRGVYQENFVVLRETEMPAALVEMGFMTNEAELKKLCDSDYQDKMAQGIADGIVQYLNSQNLA